MYDAQHNHHDVEKDKVKIRRFRESSVLRYLSERELAAIPNNSAVYEAARKIFNSCQVFPNEAKFIEDRFLVDMSTGFIYHVTKTYADGSVVWYCKKNKNGCRGITKTQKTGNKWMAKFVENNEHNHVPFNVIEIVASYGQLKDTCTKIDGNNAKDAKQRKLTDMFTKKHRNNIHFFSSEMYVYST